MPAAQHHERFYFTLVTFLVEDQLFRVPYSSLTQSEVFRDVFLLPVEAHGAEGHLDTNPIVLEGIKKEDFQSLMKLLCPMSITRLPPDGLPETPEEWMSVLKLSKMWSFNSVYTFAINQLEPMLLTRPLDKVELAEEYGITEWLVPGLLALARRAEPVETEDVRRLGLDTALKLAEVRESTRQTVQQNTRLTSPGPPPIFGVAPSARHSGTNIFDLPETTAVTVTATGPRGETTCDFTDRIHEVFKLKKPRKRVV